MIRILFFLVTLCWMAPLMSSAQNVSWQSVSLGTEHSIALQSDGSIWGCGSNLSGQLAMVPTDPAPNFNLIQITEYSDWHTISCGGVHTIGLRQDKSLWGWGGNTTRQINESGATNVTTPFKIGEDNDWNLLAAGQAHSLAIKEDGTLWSWGFNFAGQLGHSGTTNIGAPRQVGTESDWIIVSAGGYHSLGIRSDSTLWGWGFNANGQVGVPPGANVLTPTQIGPSGTKWIATSAGFEFSTAISAEGHLYAWGFNGNGQAGTGNTIQVNSPTMIHEGPWRTVRSGSAYSFAIHEDGSLYAWGANIDGACGIPGIQNVLVPTQVSDETDWVMAVPAQGLLANNSVFGFHTMALKEDGLAICVTGANYIGQLGTGTVTARNSLDCIVGELMTNLIDNQLMTEVSIYPNPIQEMLYLEVPSGLENARWIIRDVNGVVVNQGILSGEMVSIPASQLHAGVYIISAINDKHYFSKKIVKQ